jgi:hypothetical protein
LALAVLIRGKKLAGLGISELPAKSQFFLPTTEHVSRNEQIDRLACPSAPVAISYIQAEKRIFKLDCFRIFYFDCKILSQLSVSMY